MNEYDDLVKQLRDHQNGGRRRECEDAADAIQSLQARVAELEKDVALQRDAALEEAAKMCEIKADGWDFMRADPRDPVTARNMGNRDGCEECAAAIRELKDTA